MKLGFGKRGVFAKDATTNGDRDATREGTKRDFSATPASPNSSTLNEREFEEVPLPSFGAVDALSETFANVEVQAPLSAPSPSTSPPSKALPGMERNPGPQSPTVSSTLTSRAQDTLPSHVSATNPSTADQLSLDAPAEGRGPRGLPLSPAAAALRRSAAGRGPPNGTRRTPGAIPLAGSEEASPAALPSQSVGSPTMRTSTGRRDAQTGARLAEHSHVASSDTGKASAPRAALNQRGQQLSPAAREAFMKQSGKRPALAHRISASPEVVSALQELSSVTVRARRATPTSPVVELIAMAFTKNLPSPPYFKPGYRNFKAWLRTIIEPEHELRWEVAIRDLHEIAMCDNESDIRDGDIVSFCRSVVRHTLQLDGATDTQITTNSWRQCSADKDKGGINLYKIARVLIARYRYSFELTDQAYLELQATLLSLQHVTGAGTDDDGLRIQARLNEMCQPLLH